MERSAAADIFFNHYIALVPESFLHNDNKNRKVGYISSGNASVDSMMINSLRRCNQTIATIASLNWRGAEVILVNEMDMVEIYRTIVKHLSEWRDFSAMGLDRAHIPPIEDFRALEELVIKWHVRVQELMPTAPSVSKITEAILSMNRSRSRASLVRERTAKLNEEFPIYVSIVDDIERNLGE